MSNDSNMTEFVDLCVDNEYEIGTTFPFVIRRKRDNFIPSEWVDSSTGYIRVTLNGKKYLKHRIIAEQFIPNPDNLPQIDHINRNRADYRIENLRFVSNRTNQMNRSSTRGVVYEFIDDIPEEAIVVDFYDTKTERRYFPKKQYYYYNDDGEDIFYSRITDDGIYRVMHINTLKNGSQFVSMRDTDHKAVSVVINRFKYQHSL